MERVSKWMLLLGVLVGACGGRPPAALPVSPGASESPAPRGVAHLESAASVAVVPESKPCTRRDCDDHLRVLAKLPRDASSVRVSLCWGDTCCEGRVDGFDTIEPTVADPGGDVVYLRYVHYTHSGHLFFQFGSAGSFRMWEAGPARFHVATDGGTTLIDESLDLEWEALYPNGKDCDEEPACRRAKLEL